MLLKRLNSAVFSAKQEGFFSFEMKRCYLVDNRETKETNEKDTKDKITYEDTTVSQIQEDAKTVQDTLNNKIKGITPLMFKAFSHNQIMENIDGQEKAWLPFKKFGDMMDSTSSLLEGAGKTTVKTLKEVTYKEEVIVTAINNLENQKDNLEDRKKEVLDLQKSAQGLSSNWNYLNPLRPFEKVGEAIDNYKFNKSEIKGTEKKIKVLKRHKKSVSAERKDLEETVKGALKQQLKTKENAISAFERYGLDNNDASLLLKAIAKGEVKVGDNLNLTIGKITGDKEHKNKLEKILKVLKEKFKDQNMSDMEKESITNSLNMFVEKGGEKVFDFEESIQKRESFSEQQQELQGLKELSVGGKNISLKRFSTKESKFKGNYEVLSNENNETVFVRTDPKNGVLKEDNFIVLKHVNIDLSPLIKPKGNSAVKKYLKEERSRLEKRHQELSEKEISLAFAKTGNESMKVVEKELKNASDKLQNFKNEFDLNTSKKQKKLKSKTDKQTMKKFKENFKDIKGLKEKEAELAGLESAYQVAMSKTKDKLTGEDEKIIIKYDRLEKEKNTLTNLTEKAKKAAKTIGKKAENIINKGLD